ncbi:ABC transporter ATP-binding protein [Brenneria populi]|uniref:ABC transporter ATP-binding protein n=1 Tax=Brenneria populi TaxID=1505588 RepID=A0ABU6JSA1_9GAMM|nr:ABC transporter ATP-binding protein [Brenneria populi Li et al. 2015]
MRRTTTSSSELTPKGFLQLITLAPYALGGAIATAIASAALSVAPFWIIYRITAQLFSPQPDMTAVWRLIGWAVALLALRWAFMAVSHVLAHIGAFSIQYRLKIGMAKRLGEVPLSFFARRGSGSLRRVLNDDVNSLEGFFAHMLPDAAAAAAVPVAALILLFAANWPLTLAALAPLPLAMLAQWWMMRRSRRRIGAWNDLQKRIANQVGEYIRGVHVIKSFGLTARSFGDLADAIHGAVDWVQDYAKSSTGGWVLFTTLLSVNLLVVAPLGAWLLARGALDLPTLVMFLLVAPAVLSPLLRLTFAMGEQLQRAAALERINDILAAPPLPIQNAMPIPAGPLHIACRDLRQRYDARLALDGVSFQARAGQLTALVGASGSGKSTLVKLVARLYEFESGSLTIGGVDIRQWPLDALLARMSIVFQEVFLLHGTVRDNLALARPDASDAQIEAAARAAQAHDFIRALPQGYDTVLGERGASLSGGERQRLSVARALLKDAPILLLDEVTASIDAENEILIQQALNRLCAGRTVLMIAHRLGTIMHADNIVVLEQGRVAGQGTHEALLTDCPAYQKLWNDYIQAEAWSLGAAANGAAGEEK